MARVEGMPTPGEALEGVMKEAWNWISRKVDLGEGEERDISLRNPFYARQRTEEALEEAMFSFSPVSGMVKGASKGAGRVIRDALKREAQKRGVPSRELVDEVARGLWFHGRKTYPKGGETFGGARRGVGNLGEPSGISLTADKELLKRSFAKTTEKEAKAIDKLRTRTVELREKEAGLLELEELYRKEGTVLPVVDYRKLTRVEGQISKVDSKLNELLGGPSFARVHPLFGGVPKEKILPAWRGKGTEWAQDILRDTYKESAGKILKRHGDPNLRMTETIGPIRKEVYVRGILEQNQKEFNDLISQGLRKKGYKALLYSPARYGEYEMRMLDPSDVLMVDIRRQTDIALGKATRRPTIGQRSSGQAMRMRRWEKETAGYGMPLYDEAAPSSLGSIYEDIDMSEILMDFLRKGK